MGKEVIQEATLSSDAQCGTKQDYTVAIIVGVMMAVLLAVVILVMFLRRKRRREREEFPGTAGFSNSNFIGFYSSSSHECIHYLFRDHAHFL